MNNIIMINVGQYFSGAEKIFFNLLKIMEKTPSVIKVFCSKNILSHAPQAGNKTDIEGANKPQDLVRALFKTLWQYRWLSKRKVTIILNNKRALLLSPFIKIICGSSARTIFYEHGFQRNVYKKTMVELIIFLFCDSCITVSCATKKEHWHINQRKISQIYNGLPDLPKEEDNPTPEIVKHSDPGAYKIAYVSAFRTWKGQLDFLKIFSKLSQKNYTLYYIGGAEDSVSEKYYDEVKADEGVEYSDELTIDIQDLGLYVACPPHPHNVKPIDEVLGTEINSVIIGSCTNASVSDIQDAERVLKGKKTDPKTRFALIPATRDDFVDLNREGTMINLLDAGGDFFGVGCSTCAKGQYGLTGGETAVTMTTGNRNTQGKIGPADVYLASPAVAAATALTGKISRPEAN